MKFLDSLSNPAEIADQNDEQPQSLANLRAFCECAPDTIRLTGRLKNAASPKNIGYLSLADYAGQAPIIEVVHQLVNSESVAIIFGTSQWPYSQIKEFFTGLKSSFPETIFIRHDDRLNGDASDRYMLETRAAYFDGVMIPAVHADIVSLQFQIEQARDLKMETITLVNDVASCEIATKTDAPIVMFDEVLVGVDAGDYWANLFALKRQFVAPLLTRFLGCLNPLPQPPTEHLKTLYTQGFKAACW